METHAKRAPGECNAAKQPPARMPHARKSLMGNLITVQDLVEKSPFTEEWLRSQLKKRAENGLGECTYNTGGRLFIHEERFDAWFEKRFKE